MNNFKKLVLLALSAIFSACSQISSKNNNCSVRHMTCPELKEVITEKYASDSLKLEAALFLLSNMKGKQTKDILVKDNKYKTIEIQLYQPEITRDNIHKYLDSLNYTLIDTTYADEENIDTTFFYQNIEQAFAMWRTKPWSKNYSFDLFCEFILPYRIGNEKLHDDWRLFFQDKYLPTLDTLQKNNQVEHVFQYIKNDLQQYYRFAFNTIDLKPTMTLNEALSYGKGNCEDVANLLLYALRAVGVAATIDYIPLWGKTDYGHCELVYWNEVNQAQLLKTGNLLSSPPPKVFRKLYSVQKTKLPNSSKTHSGLPPQWIEESHFLDVTVEYNTTSTITVKPNKYPQQKTLYLNVFNAGQWQPIAKNDSISPQTGEFIFHNIGKNNVYLPSVYAGSENTPIACPFIIEQKGSPKHFKVKADSLISIVLPIKQINSKLYYWNHKWIDMGTGIKMKDSILFRNIPSNTLYYFADPNSKYYQRIFTYKNNEVTYW